MLRIIGVIVVLAVVVVLVLAAGKPDRGGTNVTWVMDGPTPFVGKIMHVFINMDRMVGTDFEAGLANLKTAAEHEPARSAS